MNCVILQPSYIPWRGYFHQIQKADTFVFYDDVQYDKHGWRNRNKIKTATGAQWLTLPVHTKNSLVSPIDQIRMSNETPWSLKHWTTLKQNYTRAPFFKQYAPLLEPFYNRTYEYLADFTIDLTVALAGLLGITGTRFVRSSQLAASGSKTDRLQSILTQLQATHYISGPSAKAYLDVDKLNAVGIGVEFMAYDYPEYPQLYPPFEPYVSALDLLFMTGPDAPRYIWSA